MSLRRLFDRLRPFVDRLGAMNNHHAPGDLEARFAEDVERLIPGAAAAVFTCDPNGDIVTRRAAGPGWRTAERDAPAWLGPHSHAVAQIVRTANPMIGEFMFASRLASESCVRELVQLPLIVDGDWWGMLVVLRPTDPASRAEDLWIVDACARHFSAALARISRRNPRLIQPAR
jgi:hypothetical protein